MKKLSLFFTVLFVTARLVAQTNSAPVRLALIVESSEASTVGDVLTAELSKNGQLHLLERTEIEKVYREQGLSAGNKDYLKLGQILGADGLLLLETIKDGNDQFLNVRLVATKSGVLLTSERFPWPLPNVTDWAAGLAKHLSPLVPKLNVLIKDAVPISIVNFRSAVQSAEARELEQQLTFLAIERLSRERQVFVLERRKMQLLSEEVALKGLDDSVFWNGSYLLEGTVDREGYSREKMTISARLAPPQGGVPIAIEVGCSRTNLSEAVNQLTDAVLAKLKLNPSGTPWNPADEAEQFFSEARWAFRWGLFSQAQAASESAWALGKHTREVAGLRIRAYGEEASPGTGFNVAGLAIPAMPDFEKLKPVMRALDLFRDDARLVFPNMKPDLEWSDIGYRVLQTAVSIIASFYNAAETRVGNEERLAELRAKARETFQFLSVHPPSIDKLNKRNNFDFLKWEEAGICFEKPEDVLPVYRQMLEAGYHPSQLPRVVGWSWEDRKRVPHLVKNWVEELRAATNTPVRLEALLLAVARAPDDANGSFRASENELIAAMWNNREWILDTTDNTSLIPRTEQVLAQEKPFIILRQRLRKEYLSKASVHDSRVFYVLFPSVQDNYYSQEEAQELMPLVEAFVQRTSNKINVTYLRNQFQRIAGVPVDKPSSVSSGMPAEKPIMAKFVRWNLKNQNVKPDEQPQLQKLILRGNKLWSRVRYATPKSPWGWTSGDSPTIYVSVNTETGMCEEILFPDKLGKPDASFEVTDDSLFVSVQNHLERYRFRERTWDSIPIPMESGAQILGLNGRLYLATSESLFEVAPESQTIQVLVSSRRTPPANEMDSLWESNPHLYARRDGKLGVVIANRCFVFSPTTRRWSRFPPLPANKPGSYTVPLFSDDGAQILLTGYLVRRHLLGFWNDNLAIDSLLEQPWAWDGEKLDPDLEKLLSPPRWEWPRSFDLEGSSILADGKKLWILNPRRKVWNTAISSQKTVSFDDEREATLVHFELEFRQPLSVPICFESSGQQINPFDPDQGQFPSLLDRIRGGIGDMPFWLNTPQGLVFSVPALGGHWLISKAEVEVRMQEQRALLQKRNSTKALNP